MEAIVLAGGFGTRLAGVVPDRPKPLAAVAGRPFLAWLLDALAQAGVGRAVLATGHRGDMVADAIGPRHAGMAIAYSREAAPLGTGGAIRDALARTDGPRVLALNGDSYLRVDHAALFAAPAPLAMAVLAVPDAGRYGAVTVRDGFVTGFVEKTGRAVPGLINGGVYALSRDLPALRRAGAFSFERDVLQAARDVAAIRAPGPFIDIGTPDDYARAQDLLPAWHAA